MVHGVYVVGKYLLHDTVNLYNKPVQLGEYNVQVTYPINDFSQLKIAVSCSQKAGKAILESPDFKISWWGMPLDPPRSSRLRRSVRCPCPINFTLLRHCTGVHVVHYCQQVIFCIIFNLFKYF